MAEAPKKPDFEIAPIEEPSGAPRARSDFEINPIKPDYSALPSVTATPKQPMMLDPYNRLVPVPPVPPTLPLTREGGRLGLETAGAMGGGALGLRVGGSFGYPQAGLRIGEAVGAGAGSLLSETFDPTEHPFSTAATAAAFTFGTGIASEGATQALRLALGKPHEAGQALLDILSKYDRVPPAGAVLDSSLAQDAQSYGGSAFFVGRRIGKQLEEGQAAISQDIQDYLSSFQRYHNGAKAGYAAADDMLRLAGLTDTRIVQVPKEAILSLRGALKTWRNEGALERFPADLGWLARFNPDIPMPDHIPLTVNEASALETLIFNRAREIETAPVNLMTAADATKLSSEIKNIAGTVQSSIEDAVTAQIKNGKLPPEYRTLMVQSNDLWRQWKQGEIVEDMLASAGRDLSSPTPKIAGQSLLAQLDALIRREKDIGHPLLDSQIKENIRTYAIALKAAKESAGEGAFKLAGRQGQLVGYTGMIAGLGMGNPVLAAGAAVPAIGPPALAWLFTNKTANSMLVRGLRAEPGTAASARLSRELISLMAANGWVSPQRVPPAVAGGVTPEQSSATFENTTLTPAPGVGAPLPPTTTPEDFTYGRMRSNMAPNDPMQRVIAPLEHREFARTAVRENPAMLPSLALAIPLYQAAKLGGLAGSDATPASLDQIFGGYEGAIQGLRDRLTGRR